MKENQIESCQKCMAVNMYVGQKNSFTCWFNQKRPNGVCQSYRVFTESGKSGKVREFENWSGNIKENQKIPWMLGKTQGILLVHVIKKKMTLFGNSYLSLKCTY